jgi:hypothetical protein
MGHFDQCKSLKVQTEERDRPRYKSAHRRELVGMGEARVSASHRTILETLLFEDCK